MLNLDFAQRQKTQEEPSGLDLKFDSAQKDTEERLHLSSNPEIL